MEIREVVAVRRIRELENEVRQSARESTHARFTAIGLLVVTLLKVFLYDLAAIESIFRIGALIGVAASFLYQRFLSRSGPS